MTENPIAGGRYIRDPETGELAVDTDVPVARPPEQPAPPVATLPADDVTSDAPKKKGR